MRCLLVEDDPPVATLMAQVLAQRGFEVVTRADADAAWDIFQRESFELLVLDLILPGRDGLELCRQVSGAQARPRAYILVVTAREGPQELQAVLEAGADDYLAKPLELDLLKIRLAVAERHMAHAAERARVELALRTSEERYRLLAEHSTDIISQHAADGTYLYLSPAVTVLLGYDSEELLGKSPYDFIHADDLDRVRSAPPTLVGEHMVYTIAYRTLHKDGRYLWFETTCKAILDAQTQEVRDIVCVSRDISERQRQSQALGQSEEKWRSLVENAPDFIMMIDRAGRIEFINKTIPELSPEAVIGRSCFEFALPESAEKLRAAMVKVFEQGQSEGYEGPGPTTGGDLGWYSVRIGPVRVGEMVEAAVLIITEITGRRRAEEGLLKEQLLLKRLIDLQERERQLVAYEIHDGLAQYLTGSLMHLEAFGQLPPGATAEQEFGRGANLLRTAVSEARRLISGLRPPILDEAGIVAAVEYLVNEARQFIPEVNYAHQLTFDRLMPQLETAVFRIVQEALTNVRRHSEAQQAAVELTQEKQTLRIEVTDWGVGFEPSKVGEDRFGLQGIRERARLFGGQATIDSKPGQGTRVVVELPIANEPDAE